MAPYEPVRIIVSRDQMFVEKKRYDRKIFYLEQALNAFNSVVQPLFMTALIWNPRQYL